MEKQNLVQCKRCTKEFNYKQNISGNARQLCKECRTIVDDNELSELVEQTIIEGNRYFINAPKRKNEYDPVEILVDGIMPELKNNADKFVCTMELANFIKNNGLCCAEYNIMKFKKHLDSKVHSVLFELYMGTDNHENLVDWCYKNEGKC